MVDQIQEWLKLIPPEERQRWSWLLDQNTTAFGIPRMIDTPQGRTYNPLSYPSDLASAIGTAVLDPTREHAVKPALGAATYAAQLLPSTRPDLGRRRIFSEEPEVPLQGTDFAGYWTANRPTEGIPGWMAGLVEDPSAYIGGPIGEAARGLAALPLVRQAPGVARGLGAVAGADEAYQAAAGAVVGTGLRGLAWPFRQIPAVRQLLEDSPQKALSAFGGGLRRAVDDPLARDQLEALVDPSALGLKGQAVDWEKTIRPAWETLDTAISESAHPLQQAVLVRQRAKALELENVLEARFEQHRIALEEGRLAGEISNAEFGRETRSLWQLQARAVRALQLGLIDSVNAVKGQGDEALARLVAEAEEGADPATLHDVFGRVGDDAVQGGTLTTALRRANDEALAAHDLGTAIKGGTSGVDKVEGLFSMSMGEEGQRIAALQAQDPFYRQARTAAIKELNDAADAVFARYGDVATPEDLAALDDASRTAFQAAEVELAPFTRTPEQALAGLGEDKRNAILKVWDTDSNVSLPKQLRRVLNARRALTDQVSPALHDWYRTMGYSLEQRTAAVEAALSSADRLLAEPALLSPEAAALKKAVEDRLNKFNGDLLEPGNAPRLAANLTTSAFATSLGIKAPHPLLGAAATQLAAWKEQAILSPAFQFANLIGGLVLGEAGGVSGIRVLNLLKHTLPQMKGVIMEGRPIDLVFDGASSRAVSGVFGDAAGMIHLSEDVLGRSSGEALNIGGQASGPAKTASGRIPLVIRSGIPALTTGGSYWAGNPDDPDRARNALLVGGAAGAFGAATPRFAFYNQNLSAASEGAMRGAALMTGTEEALGSVATGGLTKVFHDTTIEAVLGKPTRVTSIGKELTRSDMLPGLNTVSGMQTLSDFLPQPKATGVELPPLGAPPTGAPRPEGPLPPLEGPPIPDTVGDILHTGTDTPAWAMTREQFHAQYPPDLNLSAQDYAEEGARWLETQGGFGQGPGFHRLPPDDEGTVSFFFNDPQGNAVAMATVMGTGPGRTPWVESLAIDSTRGLLSGRAANAVLNEVATLGPVRVNTTISPEAADLLHRAVVERAVAQGKPVPPEVLADYPRLERRVATTVVEEPSPIEVAPPDRLASRVLGLHRAGPSPTATAGGQTDIAAVRADFAATNGWMSPDALEQSALRHGATAEEAARLRSVWDQDTTVAYNAGMKRSNDIHFDYSDVNRLVAGARDTGIAPFITWQTKALPRFATLLLQNPRFLVAIDGLNNLSDQDVDEAGLTSRYARLVKLGVLGDVLAEQVLGRAGGTVLGAPLKALFPYGDVGREGTVPDNANPLEKTLAALRPLGLSPGPVVTLPLMAAGAIGELPVDLNPTSRYLRPLSTQLTGREADPEILTRRLMGAARQATGASTEPTVTGDFLRDRAIRQRIAEIAVEETGKPPSGPYLLAMDDPASNIWLRARAQIDRQRMGESLLGATVPFRTKYLSDTEAEVRRIREATRVGPTDTAARRAMPATAAELAAAELAARKKPLKPEETLTTRVGQARWIAAENAAAAANPLARTLNSLGGDDALSRQFPEYLAFQRRTKHMNPKRKGQLLAEFLGPRQALRTYLANNSVYG